jgi:orotate phosphoribosyltransferase-like protein
MTTKVHFCHKDCGCNFFDKNIDQVRNLVAYGVSGQEIAERLSLSNEETYLLVAAAKMLNAD